MNSKLYNILKGIALIWLPAAGTFVFAITDIWSISQGPQIVGTIMAIDTFLGAGLGLSARQWSKTGYDGHLLVDTSNPMKDTYTLDIKSRSLDELPDRKSIRLSVLAADEVEKHADS